MYGWFSVGQKVLYKVGDWVWREATIRDHGFSGDSYLIHLDGDAPDTTFFVDQSRLIALRLNTRKMVKKTGYYKDVVKHEKRRRSPERPQTRPQTRSQTRSKRLKLDSDIESEEDEEPYDVDYYDNDFNKGFKGNLPDDDDDDYSGAGAVGGAVGGRVRRIVGG